MRTASIRGRTAIVHRVDPRLPRGAAEGAFPATFSIPCGYSFARDSSTIPAVSSAPAGRAP